jgi:hypothetical protein
MRLIERLRTGRTIVLVEDDMDAVFALATTELISTRCNRYQPPYRSSPKLSWAAPGSARRRSGCYQSRVVLLPAIGPDLRRVVVKNFPFPWYIDQRRTPSWCSLYRATGSGRGIGVASFDCSIALCSHERLRNIQNRPPFVGHELCARARRSGKRARAVLGDGEGGGTAPDLGALFAGCPEAGRKVLVMTLRCL